MSENGRVGIGTMNPNYQIDFGDDGGWISVRSDNINHSGKYGYGMGYWTDGANNHGLAFSAGGNFIMSDQNNTPYLFIKKGGNVGIGTTSPEGKLEIANASSVTSYQDHANTSIIMRNPTSTANFNSSITWTDHTPNTWGHQSMLGITGNCGASHGLSLWGFNGRRISLCSIDNTTDSTPWDSPSLTVWMNKVGIGTSSPEHKLHISGGGLLIDGTKSSITQQGVHIQWNRSGGYGESWIINNKGQATSLTNSGIKFGMTDSTGVVSEKMFINYNGNVGIGTTSPGQKLQVNGNVICQGKLGVGTTSIEDHFVMEIRRSGTSRIGMKSDDSKYLDIGIHSDGRAFFWSHDDNHIEFGTNNAERMVIAANGNVGIGTDSPGAKLTISHTRPTSITDSTDFYLGIGYGEHNHHSYRLIGFGYLSATTSCYPAYIGWKTTNNAGSTQGDLVFGTRNSTGATTVPTERMRIKDNGHVGIGTTTPTRPLHIEMTTDMPNSHYTLLFASKNRGWYGSSYQNWYSHDGGNHRPLSIYSAGGIWIGSGAYFASSDRRIKENIIDVSDNQALEILREIPCRYYEYKDKISRGTEKTIGFIAQEVKEKLPIAVATQTNIIPNEMRILTDISWNDTTLYTDLSDCSGVKYRFYISNDISGDEIMKEVIGNSDNSFTFDQSWNHVFCYGKEIDDFHTLDKQKLFAVNFSATQELDRQQQADKAKIAELESKNQTLENKVVTLESELAAIKQHLGL